MNPFSLLLIIVEMANDLNEEVVVIGATTAFLGATEALLGSHNNRDTDNETRPYADRDVDQENYVNSVLYCGDTHYLNQIRMRHGPFFKLCEMLERRPLFVNAMHMSVRELMFLHLLGHNNRPNNTFKSSLFVATTNMISKKFDVKWLSDHVVNHLRTIKTAWSIIAKLRNQSGYEWGENMRMICICSPDANPTHEKYFNKKIDMYDVMTVVVRKDVT
ncbi:hypothetical protein Cgig2_008381 [Carnegiea gigantea]|uniref:DUF8040 domain-containing protein n=1 Tax=Carnegiea gigantea TaxID=171969 RepID=A0A9Q1JR95_9CARY|nr:hypothetical protein Cgig2_008381 [Carnegiea gigantea]